VPAPAAKGRFSAFGLEVASQVELPVPDQGGGGPADLELLWGDPESTDDLFATEERQVRRRNRYDGCPYELTEGADGDLLFRYGQRASFHLDPELTALRCFASERNEPTWQRVLLDTVLWSISLLRGFELLHAAAVVHEERLIAIVGLSGGGKTTLAAELLSRGGTLFADDILAFSPGSALAHPGPPLMNLGNGNRLDGARLIAPIGEEAWVAVDRPTDPAPRPVDRIVLVERRAGAELSFERQPGNNLLLLPHSLSFPHQPERLTDRFEVFGDVAERAPIFRLTADLDVTPADLADLVTGS
jgi:hypothetical protein